MNRMQRAIQEIRAGRPVIVMDHPDRENEGDLVMAAEYASPDWINFMAKEGRGLICAAAAPHVLDRLDIPRMVSGTAGRAQHESPFTLSVEAANGISTGISAADRSRTFTVLADPDAGPTDINVPGHVFPLRAKAGGLAERKGHTEASVALMGLAGMQPVAAICEIMNPDGGMARKADLEDFAAIHDLVLISIEDIEDIEDIEASMGLGRSGEETALASKGGCEVRRAAESTLPTEFGRFRIHAFHDDRGREHVALVLGHVRGNEPVLVRMHSECLTGEVFGSLRCDCADQLREAMAAISRRGAGVVVYLRQEGRGIGLANKIRAYALQDEGYDTVDANRLLGLPDDARSYRAGAAMLTDLGVSNIELLTNNPAKVKGLLEAGISRVIRLPMELSWRTENTAYLKTKLVRMDHQAELA